MREIYDLSLHEVLHNGPISYIGGFTLLEVHKNVTTNSTALTSCHFTPKSCEQPTTHGSPQMHVMWVCKRKLGLGLFYIAAPCQRQHVTTALPGLTVGYITVGRLCSPCTLDRAVLGVTDVRPGPRTHDFHIGARTWIHSTSIS
jgi:hypothetical protein